jgi:hypothetical protein
LTQTEVFTQEDEDITRVASSGQVSISSALSAASSSQANQKQAKPRIKFKSTSEGNMLLELARLQIYHYPEWKAAKQNTCKMFCETINAMPQFQASKKLVQSTCESKCNQFAKYALSEMKDDSVVKDYDDREWAVEIAGLKEAHDEWLFQQANGAENNKKQQHLLQQPMLLALKTMTKRDDTNKVSFYCWIACRVSHHGLLV